MVQRCYCVTAVRSFQKSAEAVDFDEAAHDEPPHQDLCCL